MVEPKNYHIKSFVRERDFLANNFKNSYGYYLLDKPLYKEEIILHLSVDKEDNFVSINVNYANGTVLLHSIIQMIEVITIFIKK